MSRSVKPKRGVYLELRRALTYAWPYRGMMVASIGCALLMGIVQTISLSSIFPILKVLVEGKTVSGWVAEAIAARGENVPFYLQIAEAAARFIPDRPLQAIAVIFGFIAVTVVIGNLFRFAHEHLSDRVAIYSVHDLRRHVYDHLLHLPMSYFGRSGTSESTSRLMNDAALLQDGVRVLLGQLIQSPISIVMSLGLALWINWKLTLVIMLFIPPAFVIMKKLGTKVRRATRAALQKSAAMLGQIESTLGGVRVVKAAQAERFERRRYARIMQGIRREQVRLSRYEAATTPIMEITALVAIGVILLTASWMMFERRWLDQTSFMMIMFALGTIAEPMRRISKINNVMQRANAAAARLFELLDLPAERTREQRPQHATAGAAAGGQNARRGGLPGEGRIVLPPLTREICFDHVSFRYPDAPRPAVDRVFLRVPKGRSVAIVGRNGSGKTTLLALLPRFYDPTEGAVLIDGIDLRQATLRSVRSQIALVTQDSVVFPGTIAENIAYGHPLAARLHDPAAAESAAVLALRQDIEAAARRAFAHDFILAKPQGYDTPLDGLGSQLSGGQKQRLCIARAILRRAPILILDEATSQVDAESEHLIQQAIEGVMHEATTFVIAHRFSTILSADEIVVMDEGRIVGQGRHDDLLKSCEIYQQLYERQLISTTG
ncbi:MAG: ABC transporter ATP-binding protein [Phycisphaerales bacterium]|nr:ABC transporter ATP-binding protein [Phycisphaerales bacterium]